MATTARAELRPTNEATRPFGKGRATANFINNDTISITTTALRLQFLSTIYGVSADRGALIASLHWGATNG